MEFWCCIDVGVTSLLILPWHCWYIVNETHSDVNFWYQPDISISGLDQSGFNIVIKLSWYRTLTIRRKSFRIVYHVLRTCPYCLTCNCKGHVLPTSWGRPKDVLVWLYNAKGLPRDKNVGSIVILLKLSPQHSRLMIQKEEIRITCLKSNVKTYIFLPSKILSHYIWSLMNLINILHQNGLTSQQNWLFT